VNEFLSQWGEFDLNQTIDWEMENIYPDRKLIVYLD